jgi:tetratricopeptide (TPR) repeat protein
VKEKLLLAVDEARARESELSALVVDAPANADGRWNAKDHLAHVSWWRWRTARTLDAVRTGGELPPATPDNGEVQNAIIYAEVRDRPAGEVKADAGKSWEALRNAVEASSEEDLAKQHPRQTQSQIWESVPSAIGHAGTHIWSLYLDIGDEGRAMEAARWSAEMEGRFFTEPEQLAESRYNLACAYGRLGRPEKALPLLRESFAVRPDLIAHARKDTDLDRIRQDPELASLLAT